MYNIQQEKEGYSKGDCFFAKLSGYGISSVQSGYRPVVLVTSPIGLLTSDLVQVIPLTTKQRAQSINPQVSASFLKGTSYALCNQLQVLPKDALGSKLGCFDTTTMADIDAAICIALGIQHVIKSLPQDQLQQDKGELEALLPQAKELARKLEEIYERQSLSISSLPKAPRKYTKRTAKEASLQPAKVSKVGTR